MCCAEVHQDLHLDLSPGAESHHELHLDLGVSTIGPMGLSIMSCRFLTQTQPLWGEGPYLQRKGAKKMVSTFATILTPSDSTFEVLPV